MAKLVETGQKDRSSSTIRGYYQTTDFFVRLKEMVRERLAACGWRDDIKRYCKEIILKKGLEKVTVEELVVDITPRGRSMYS